MYTVLFGLKLVNARLPAPSLLPLAADRMFHVAPPVLVFPKVIQVPKVLALCTAKGMYCVLLTTVSGLVGAVVPIPTKVSAPAPFTPLMLPRTMVLLAVTWALAPIAVALLRAAEPTLAK